MATSNIKHARVFCFCLFFGFVLFSTSVKRHQLRQGVFRRRLNTKREKHKTFWQNIAQPVSFSIPSAPCVIRLLLFLRGRARACVFASACTWHICYATDKKKKGQYGAKGSSPPPITELLSIPAQTLLHLQLHLGERCHRSKHALISSLSADESVTQQYSVSVSVRTVLCWCSQKARAPAGAASALWMMNMIPHQLDLTCSRLIVRFTQPLSSILIIVLLIKGPPSKIPCKWSWQLWPWAFVSFTSSLLLLFSSWVHYHSYYPPTFFPFIWLPYFLSSSQPFSQNPPPPLLNSPILCSMFSVLPVPLVSHRIGNWQQIVPQTRVRWLQGVSPSLFC